MIPLTPVPLQTLVLNVTNQCNLALHVLLRVRRGQDRRHRERQAAEVHERGDGARRASTSCCSEAGDNTTRAHHVLRRRDADELPGAEVARSPTRGGAPREVGKDVDFSLTTNATLLRPEVIDFLADEQRRRHDLDRRPAGPAEQVPRVPQRQGSYDVVAPKIKALLQRHRTRPIGARVTLTRQTLDVRRIYAHLTDEIGFWEVGFAPVTTAPGRDYAIGDDGFDDMLGAVPRAGRTSSCDAALENRHHGFSNVRETLQEIHKGMSKAYPCGAGLGLMGVSTDGDVALCHRFAGSDAHKLGTRQRRHRSRAKQGTSSRRTTSTDKTDCQTCWARPICAGGCYHEAHTRYGDDHASRTCTTASGFAAGRDTCLEIYGELAERNPAFLAQFDDEHVEERA